jgi:putative membrane protein
VHNTIRRESRDDRRFGDPDRTTDRRTVRAPADAARAGCRPTTVRYTNDQSQVMPSDRSAWLIGLSALAVLLLGWSGWRAHDRTTWLMEIAPVVIALPLLWLSYRRFPLTSLLYGLIFAHALVLVLGGTYTYARVPLGFQLQELLQLGRNPYDKIGHFFQGFVPALIAREILVRGDYVRGRRMLAFVVVCIVLAISASYELVEWAAALALGQGANEFLGTQGDPWDTQSDMAFAFIGSITALAVLSRVHDRQLRGITGTRNSARRPRPTAHENSS